MEGSCLSHPITPHPMVNGWVGPGGVPGPGQEDRPSESLSAVQELSRVKAVALNERGQAEEELIKAKNQVRLEEVSPWPSTHQGARPEGLV